MSALMADRRDWAEDPRQASLFDALAPPSERANPGRPEAPPVKGRVVEFPRRREEPAPEGPPMPDEFAAFLAAMPATDDELALGIGRLAPAYLHRAPAETLTAAMADTVFSAVAMRRGFEELAGWSSVDRLAEVRAPVLVVAGRHDAITAWPQAERITRRLSDAQVVVLENSAHFPWLDEPDAFFEAVTDWLTRRGLIP